MDLAEKRKRRNTYQREYCKRFVAKHGVSRTVKWRRESPDAAEAHRDRERQRWYSSPTIRARHRATTLRERQALKAETFNHYGGHVCACCGETELNFLSLDHKNNNGAEERRNLGTSYTKPGAGYGGSPFYRWLRKRGYPPGYQVLCMNCNFGKRMNGGVCPHKESDWE